MDEMKFDMSGAAAVIAALSFAASLRVPLHLVGLIGRGGRTCRAAGRSSRGTSLPALPDRRWEILNTDAKGGSFCATLCTTRAASTRKR